MRVWIAQVYEPYGVFDNIGVFDSREAAVQALHRWVKANPESTKVFYVDGGVEGYEVGKDYPIPEWGDESRQEMIVIRDDREQW